MRETKISIVVPVYNAEKELQRCVDSIFRQSFSNWELLLIDEVLTPDSSRFWPASQYAPGKSQPSFDKQYLRDWLQTATVNGQPWNKTAPAPHLPQEVIDNTAAKYREALATLLA